MKITQRRKGFAEAWLRLRATTASSRFNLAPLCEINSGIKVSRRDAKISQRRDSLFALKTAPLRFNLAPLREINKRLTQPEQKKIYV